MDGTILNLLIVGLGLVFFMWTQRIWRLINWRYFENAIYYTVVVMQAIGTIIVLGSIGYAYYWTFSQLDMPSCC